MGRQELRQAMPMAVVPAPRWLGQELGGLSCCPGGLWGQTHTTAEAA